MLGPSRKLCGMRVFASCGLMLMAGALACGGEEGGSLDSPLSMESTQRLSCTIDSLVLGIPIELSHELDRPYARNGSVELTFSTVVVFNEESSLALIDAGVSKIDVVTMRVATSVEGASPSVLGTSLEAAPINDFDLEPDTDDNGIPGPHRFELAPVTVTSVPTEGADQVELGISLSEISLLLGDFQIPEDCVSPTLAGQAAAYPILPGD